MKALSYSTPWPTSIERHGKRVENRQRWEAHRHLVAQAERMVGQDHAIHSSGTYDRAGAEYILKCTGRAYGRQSITSKAITSVATITGLLFTGDACPAGQEPWYFGGFALVLDNVRVLPEPVPMTGGLGWLTIPGPQLARVIEQLVGLG